MRHDDLDGALLLLWNGLALNTGLHLAVNKLLYEVTNFLLGKLLALVQGKLLVLDCLLDGKGGPFVDLQVEITGVSAERFSVNDGEVDLTLMFLSDRLKGLSQFSALFGCFCEDVGKRDGSLERYQYFDLNLPGRVPTAI